MFRIANVAACVMVFICLSACSTATSDAAVAVQAPSESATLLTFLESLDAAQLQLQNGDATAYKELWSHGDDVTITGGFGGSIETGWAAVSSRLDWAATQFSRGRNSIERVVTRANGDFGYVVQHERVVFVVPGQSVESTRAYRVTMIFRREAGAWCVVHRHADVQTAKAPVRD